MPQTIIEQMVKKVREKIVMSTTFMPTMSDCRKTDKILTDLVMEVVKEVIPDTSTPQDQTTRCGYKHWNDAAIDAYRKAHQMGIIL